MVWGQEDKKELMKDRLITNANSKNNLNYLYLNWKWILAEEITFSPKTKNHKRGSKISQRSFFLFDRPLISVRHKQIKKIN